jgi:hypothetical protein
VVRTRALEVVVTDIFARVAGVAIVEVSVVVVS